MASNNQPSLSIEEYQEELDDSSDDFSNEIIHEDSDDDQLLVPVGPDAAVIEPSSFCVLPEVPTFLYFLSVNFQYPMVQFWLFDHFSHQYSYVTTNETDYCSVNSSTNNNSKIEEMVQTATNNYFMYISFVTSFTAIFPSLFLGTLTDKFGRKFVFYVGLFGTIAAQSLLLVIFQLNLSPNILFLSSFLQGLSGTYGLFLVAVFGMAADITSLGRQRGFRVATLEAAIALAVSFGIAMSGISVKKLGYIWSMSVSIGLTLLSLLYVFFFLPETLVERHHQPLSCKTVTKSFAFYVKDTPLKRRFKLIVVLICFLINTFCANGELNFGMLYLLHQPFCWSKELITVFSGVLILVKWLLVFLFLLLGKRWISEPAYGLIGALSSTVCFLLKGLAQSNLLIFVGSGVSLMTELVSPMCRTIMSRAVSPSEQGALFAGIGVLQMVTGAASGITMSNIYNLGLNFYLGLPYLTLAAVYFMAVILFIVLIIRAKRYPDLEKLSTTEEQVIN